MSRVTTAAATRQKKNKIFKKAKGFWGGRHRLYRIAKEAVMRAGQFAYRDRHNKKRDFRSLWIIRVNAACRLNGISYNAFINGLKKNNIALNRKVLAEIAIADPAAFTKVVEAAKK
ncbi:50S ribosomal protein L20 [candidate division TA06 bacterium]|uniref:Large ribosomal subunit protein bL20 n=1 Tax=candidate division TA06 bacterium TaxID=2250710 RepID=A0A933ID26_UNCT6|nr:50S ribosomal protein L20 [candidate division TA06 bacterium]